MNINNKYVVGTIYASFALDSLLKVGVAGLQLHLGIVCVIVFNLLVILRRPGLALRALLSEWSFLAFVGLCGLSAIILQAPGAGLMMFYLCVATNVLLFVGLTASKWGRGHFLAFQWLMIATGLSQFAAYKFFGLQLSFIDAEHYQKGYSVSHRLRGFFVEPNWFAIALAFNSLLLIGSDIGGFIRRHRLLATLTAVAMILNGSLATMGFLAVAYSIPLLKSNPVRGGAVGLLMILLLLGGLGFRNALSSDVTDRGLINYNSRLEPVLRVIGYQFEQGNVSVVFGNGLGSWGTQAVRERLSVLVFEEDRSSRDGSELPVIFFELGILGIALLLLDSYRLLRIAPVGRLDVRAGIALFVVCLVFYPILKFWMYMPYYFFIRRLAGERKLLH